MLLLAKFPTVKLTYEFAFHVLRLPFTYIQLPLVISILLKIILCIAWIFWTRTAIFQSTFPPNIYLLKVSVETLELIRQLHVQS